ncbi:MAG: GNAT family N-acetyltransferase [Actinomycetota bacterium]|nr:GNAT family N-acetyltransferase [Actinomycetota bacterium]
MKREIVHVGTPPHDDRMALLEELLQFNRTATGLTDDNELYSFTRDEAGKLVAGLYGWVWGGTCEIALFWVREDHRGRGIGHRMLHAAETRARELACHQMVLRTHSFQAPEFYARRGYEEAGVIDDYPRGHRDHFFRKPL